MEVKIKIKEKKYISLKEAAKISGYHPDYIGYLIRSGKIKGKKISRRSFWRIAPEEIIKYCQQNLNKSDFIKVKDFDLEDSEIIKKKYISLKEAAKISGYHPDYIGYLIRQGKLRAEKVYSGVAWLTTKEEIARYQKLRKEKNGLDKTSHKALIYDIFPPTRKLKKVKKDKSISNIEIYKNV